MSRHSATYLTWLIVRNEWADSLRSKRLWVVLLLYVAVALLTMNGLLSVLLRLENELAELLGLPAATQPGTVVDALWRSPRFRQMLGNAVRSDSLVTELVGQSPVVLAYAGLAFFYTPLLVALMAPLRITEDIANGTVRYIIIRTSRLSWTLGKFLGQALLLALALMVSATSAWLLARYRMAGADGWQHAGGMLRWSLRVWFYGFSFLGLVMGVAHATRSPSRSTALALLSVFGVGLGAWAFDRYAGDGWRSIFPLLRALLPRQYQMDLWRSSWSHVVTAASALCALGLTYVLAGYALFRRRDV